jgi:Secretion system C-terminal sorting domain
MKKLLKVLFAFIGFLPASYGQIVVWEKTYGWKQDDVIWSIVKTDVGYLSLGTRQFGGIYPISGYASEFVLAILGPQGDTLKLKRMGVFTPYGGIGGVLKKCSDGNYFASMYLLDTIGNRLKYTARLYKLSSLGQMQWSVDYDSSKNYLLYDVCATADGGALLIGAKDNINPNYEDGFAIRVDPNGNELWRKTFSPSILTYLYHAEILNGYSDRFLISGAAGQYIWAAWLDQHGNMLTQKFFFQDPRNYGLQNCQVLQSPDSSYVTIGFHAGSSNIRDTSNYWYLGKYSIFGTKKWGKLEGGGINSAFVNTAGQVLVSFNNLDGKQIFRKYSKQGVILDTLIISSNIVAQKTITCAAWSDGDSAVFAGDVNSGRPNFLDFYFVKMSGVGNQYIAAAKPSIVSEGGNNLSLYPNPAKDMVTIQSTGEGSFMLYNASGQVVLQEVVAQGSQVSLAHLPSGLYMYRFTTHKGASTGKVVRE